MSGGMMRTTLVLCAGSMAAADNPPFSSFNCTTMPKEAFEAVTLKNSVRSAKHRFGLLSGHPRSLSPAAWQSLLMYL